MNNLPIISLLIFLPIAAAVIVFCLPKNTNRTIKTVALSFSLLSFSAIVWILFHFDTKFYPNLSHLFQFIEKYTLIHIAKNNLILNYSVGIDGISYIFIFITILTIPFVFLTINKDKERIKSNTIFIFLLSSTLIGVFASSDMLCFYVFFELTYLILYLLIKNQNSFIDNKKYSFAFFLHLFSSFIFLIFILGLNQSATEILKDGSLINSFSISTFYQISSYNPSGILSPFNQNNFREISFIFLIIASLIKIFVLPLKYFLEQKNYFIVIVSQLLIAKLGFFIILKFIIPVFPEFIPYYFPMIANIGIILFFIISIKALLSDSINKFISTISQLYFIIIVIGICLNSVESISAAALQILNHNIIFLILFFFLYFYEKERISDKSISLYIRIIPIILIFAIVGLPGFSSFISQFLIIKAIYLKYHLLVFIVILVLFLLIFFRTINIIKKENQILRVFDYSQKIIKLEYLILLPLVILIIFLGIYPNYIFKIIYSFLHHFTQ